jgi:hypothetical protein
MVELAGAHRQTRDQAARSRRTLHVVDFGLAWTLSPEPL